MSTSKRQSLVSHKMHAGRMILIDGANLIHSGDASGKKILDIKGITQKLNGTAILVVVYMFLKHGFEVMVLMKNFFKDNKNADNNFILEELNRLEVLRFIDDGLNDDTVLLRSVEFYGAAVISRDRFKQAFYDRFPKGKASAVSYKISRRSVSTEEQQSFSVPGAMVDLACKIELKDFERLFVAKNDLDFSKVQNIHNQYLRSGALHKTFSAVNVLVDFLQCEYCYYSRYPMPLLCYFTEKEPPTRFGEFQKTIRLVCFEQIKFTNNA
ncbi:hypothetical protein M3Y97_00979900 [Aphelenchoides bicaudatus]|nr:hypothetical protein M3Y97_00979900 [Aphelenchoides bicaudatus]